jgi:opacity protein-like surface antigen
MIIARGASCRRLSLVAAGLAIATPAAAADDAQLWAGGSVSVKLSDKWRLSEEVTSRFSDHRNGLYEIESNTLVGYSIGKGVTLWAGYTHDPNYSAGHFTIMEQRAREQVAFDNFATLGPGKLSGRLRMEQRWRSGIDGTGWRIRPFVKYALPFHKGGRTAFVLSAEPFFNLNSTPFQRTRGLDRVRTFAGVSTPLARNLSVDVGYLDQHTFVPNGPDNDDHVASISMSLAL